ncbi:hypothetical protein [Granulicella sp. S190]|uniref:hypothetical protein n=1 Tax=Granulicella sp. S190 TaxID=1747226 RepID=UPI00131A63EB|nr:hypothetical protein [Granulicella sp. S190]
MKRIRRVSIEVEQREITLYATSSSWSSPDDEAAPLADSLSRGSETKMLPEELAAALNEGRVHLHRNAEGRITVCSRKDCDD